MTSRPRTSNPRGFCKYYTSPRGCYAGENCKFLHVEPSAETNKNAALQRTELTPYDQSKRCRYYAQGFCKRGESCWFKHEPLSSEHNSEGEREPCSICLEGPVTYGLLVGCNHVFCLPCIRQWRAVKNDVSLSGVNKCCPLCRAASPCVIPSSHFYPFGAEVNARSDIVAAYRASCERIPCKYFEESKTRGAGYLWCPFGRDCFFGHLKDDGKPHFFEQGVIGRRGLIPKPRYPTLDSDRHSHRFSNTVAVISRLFNAPLTVLQEAVDAAPSGLPAVLDALSIEWNPLNGGFSRRNVVDVVETSIFGELAAFGSPLVEGGTERSHTEMTSRMVLILRLMEGLSESTTDATPSTSQDPAREPLMTDSDEIPHTTSSEDTPDEVGWASEPDIQGEESEQDPAEALESSPTGYFLWTSQGQPSAMRRRNSDSAATTTSSGQPLDDGHARVMDNTPASSVSLDTPQENGHIAQPDIEAEVDCPQVHSPLPPPPGPFVTDGRGRPIVWSISNQTMEERK